MDPVARRLVAALAALDRGPMLDGRAAHLLALLPAETAAAVLSSLLALPSPPPELRHALGALCRALLPGSALPAEQRAAIHRAALANHHPAVVALLSTAAPALPPIGAAQRAAAGPRPDEETLGHRTQRARTERSRDRLARLCADDDPAVIRNLLLNPHLTEALVVRIASRRPVPVAVLDEVARSPRWYPRLAVRRTLIANPYASTSVVNALLPQLSATDLREVVADPVLHPAVRTGARAILAARRGTG